MEQALKQFDHWSEGYTEPGLSSNRVSRLKKEAVHHYEKSQDESSSNEEGVVHRQQAKLLANQLLDYPAEKVSALNLLARIALDEGFYPLASQYLDNALKIEPESAGCWYSLGHVHLAKKDYDQAMGCFSKSLDISPNETRSATSLAYTLAKKGHTVAAFQAYRKLFHVYPNDQHIQAKLFDLTPQIKADFYLEDLEEDAIRWLKLRNVNYQNLAPLVMSLLIHKYDLNNPNTVIDLQVLAKDQLLNLALGNIQITDTKIEGVLIEIRKQVLLNLIACSYQDKVLIKFAARLAIHAEHNEYVYLYDAKEQEILDLLKTSIENILNSQQPDITLVEPLTILFGMYEPPVQISQLCALKAADIVNWPATSKSFIKTTVFDYLTEQAQIEQVSEMNQISDEVSLAVKAQYEQNPYPRWRYLGYNTPTNYGRALEQELINFRAPEFFNMGKIKILIAGCGTGQHALRVARYFRNVEVTAIDITKRSLTYAKRKAEEYGIKNIQFLNLDILHLDALDDKFHVIECSGVLHHMEYPSTGLAKLKSKLLPKGLIKLGLYSEEARASIQEVRNIIQQYKVPTSTRSIRSVRQAIINNKLPIERDGILESQDFYSSSGCRDLLFHAQELLFTPEGINRLAREHDMSFLGFILSSKNKKWYAEAFPEDEKMINLYNWQKLERKHPQMFSRMYQFYLQ